MISLSFSLALNDSFSNIYFVFITLLFSFKNQQIIFTFYCPLNFTFCFSFFKNRVIQFPNKQVIPFAQKESLWNLFRFPLPRYQIDLKKKKITHTNRKLEKILQGFEDFSFICCVLVSHYFLQKYITNTLVGRKSRI